jgi:pimeloyl-ACP methyl ester carboxylesterase
MTARLSPANLVARPDRVDFRDRLYSPPLRSLPPLWPPRDIIERNLESYKDYILDQGTEGACTGFGLAAVINFIYWSGWREKLLAAAKGQEAKLLKERPPLVSAPMLYHNARLYDEWEGSDYEGSSCRGAMKGWHKHGVCENGLWKKGARMQPDDWRHDAARRPLGAYYRVDARSIADMQAALFEVRSVYCSATVHEGWREPSDKSKIDGIKLARIRFEKDTIGGHAFALIGYTSEGFIVQNSWGPDWGTGGFALLSYEDWIKNGFDAWVAAVGAPMSIESSATATRTSLIAQAGNMVKPISQFVRATSQAAAAKPWTEERAYRHAIVLGNDGKLIQRLVGAANPSAALQHVTQSEVAASGHKKLVIYVHGGLNDEAAAINRARRLGPWFDANGIHPLFIVWRTGFMESLGAIAQDEIAKYEEQLKEIQSKGLGDVVDAAVKALKEAKDRAFEMAAEKLIGKAVWSQMKQNAERASGPGSALAQMLKALSVHNGMRFHLLGHSAGSIMIGHLLDTAGRAATSLSFDSCGLYAPACTLDFAAGKYGKALAQGGPLGRGRLAIDVLTDEAEVDDEVGPYGKSLLYLVSRAFEDVHKMPLLGLDLAVQPGNYNGKNTGMELAKKEQAAAYAKWKAAAGKLARVSIKAHKGPKIRTSLSVQERIAHGTFDNDIDVVNASLTSILDGPPKLKITDLTGF